MAGSDMLLDVNVQGRGKKKKKKRRKVVVKPVVNGECARQHFHPKSTV